MWRSRFIVSSFGELPESFTVGGCSATSRPLGESQAKEQVSLVDFAVDETDVRDAFFRSVDCSEDLLDRVAYLSYAPARARFVSVSLDHVAPGSTSPLLLITPFATRSRCRIGSEQLKALEERADRPASLAMRVAREALSSPSCFRTFSDLWTGIESVADAVARRDDEWITRKCECGRESRTSPASFRRIKQFFRRGLVEPDSTPSAESWADKARALRGKLVHGGRLRDRALREEVSHANAPLQSAAFTAIAESTGIRPLAGSFAHFEAYCTIYDLRAPSSRDDSWEIFPTEFRANFTISGLPTTVRLQDSQIGMNVVLPKNIDPLAFPEIRPPA